MRGPVWSRGLGDVYKRRVLGYRGGDNVYIQLAARRAATLPITYQRSSVLDQKANLNNATIGTKSPKPLRQQRISVMALGSQYQSLRCLNLLFGLLWAPFSHPWGSFWCYFSVSRPFGMPGGRFGDGVRFWWIFPTKVASILGSILIPKSSKVAKKLKKVAFETQLSKALLPELTRNRPKCDPISKYHMFRRV